MSKITAPSSWAETRSPGARTSLASVVFMKSTRRQAYRFFEERRISDQKYIIYTIGLQINDYFNDDSDANCGVCHIPSLTNPRNPFCHAPCRPEDILAVWPADHAKIHFRRWVKRLEVFSLLRAVRAISARRKATAASKRTLQQGAPGTPFTIEHTAVSCAIFSPGTGIRFLQVATSLGPVDIELSTRLFDGWGSVQHGVVAITKGFAEGAADVSGALGPTARRSAVNSFAQRQRLGRITSSGLRRRL